METLKKGDICYVFNINKYDPEDFFTYKVVVTKVLKTVVYCNFTNEDYPFDIGGSCFKFKARKSLPYPEYDLGGAEFYYQLLYRHERGYNYKDFEYVPFFDYFDDVEPYEPPRPKLVR